MTEKSIEELEKELARMDEKPEHCHYLRQSHAGNSTCAFDKRRSAWTTQEGECIGIESGCPIYVKS